MPSTHCCVIAVVAFFAIGLSGAHSAGGNAVEEAAIRKMVAAIDAKGNTGMSLPDFIFWSGAYKQPVVGTSDDKDKVKAGEGAISDRAPGSQKLKTEPIRIVVADNKDLAYEYSNFILDFTTKGGKQINVKGGVLRVWQKQDGAWKQAAIFARGYDE